MYSLILIIDIFSDFAGVFSLLIEGFPHKSRVVVSYLALLVIFFEIFLILVNTSLWC